MLAIVLGVAWLLLGPLALFVLVRGRNPARIGAVLTLALLEICTVVHARHHEPAAQPVAQHPATADCAERIPALRRAALTTTGLTLSWNAVSGECDTAAVLLRRDGRQLRVWVHEGSHPAGARTVPVRVTNGVASLRVPVHLAHPRRLLAVDGRTGHRIPVTRTPVRH
ncbi:hypothetical protein [Thermoactinospora rubra]|uniref:hypothetical protein n=1 Tax=Thermoactinospora rubra TaxID=1088767 RepID=UPI000A0FCB7E|nr:hypothetical protein [Thermoactinospora rubra]